MCVNWDRSIFVEGETQGSKTVLTSAFDLGVMLQHEINFTAGHNSACTLVAGPIICFLKQEAVHMAMSNGVRITFGMQHARTWVILAKMPYVKKSFESHPALPE